MIASHGFYTEIVIVTIISLVAAKAWERLLNKALNTYVGNTLIVDFISAFLMTAVAIILLNAIFKRKKDKDKDSYYNYGLHE